MDNLLIDLEDFKQSFQEDQFKFQIWFSLFSHSSVSWEAEASLHMLVQVGSTES